MVRSRTWTALVGIVASVAISVLVWWYFETFVLFLFVPFVPFLFRARTETPTFWECPECGFRTTDESFQYCPRDSTQLRSRTER